MGGESQESFFIGKGGPLAPITISLNIFVNFLKRVFFFQKGGGNRFLWDLFSQGFKNYKIKLNQDLG